MTRIIPQHHLASHKVKVRKIAHELNKSWSDKLHDWFSICDITDAHADLWGDDADYLKQPYDILDEFHCINWRYIGPDAKETIVKNVIRFLETPYLVYQNGRFIMYDREAVAAEDARQAEERKRKLAERAERDAKPRSWLTKLWHKLTDEEL